MRVQRPAGGVERPLGKISGRGLITATCLGKIESRDSSLYTEARVFLLDEEQWFAKWTWAVKLGYDSLRW